jgi:hypothetical protein
MLESRQRPLATRPAQRQCLVRPGRACPACRCTCSGAVRAGQTRRQRLQLSTWPRQRSTQALGPSRAPTAAPARCVCCLCIAHLAVPVTVDCLAVPMQLVRPWHGCSNRCTCADVPHTAVPHTCIHYLYSCEMNPACTPALQEDTSDTFEPRSAAMPGMQPRIQVHEVAGSLPWLQGPAPTPATGGLRPAGCLPERTSMLTSAAP